MKTFLEETLHYYLCKDFKSLVGDTPDGFVESIGIGILAHILRDGELTSTPFSDWIISHPDDYNDIIYIVDELVLYSLKTKYGIEADIKLLDYNPSMNKYITIRSNKVNNTKGSLTKLSKELGVSDYYLSTYWKSPTFRITDVVHKMAEVSKIHPVTIAYSFFRMFLDYRLDRLIDKDIRRLQYLRLKKKEGYRLTPEENAILASYKPSEEVLAKPSTNISIDF